MNKEELAGYESIGFIKNECKENNVIYFIHKHREIFPDKIALKWVPKDILKNWDSLAELKHNSLTYGELCDKVTCIAAGLKKIGISKGDRVIIFVPMAPELYLTMFAVQRLGAIAVFLDSWARREHLSVCVETVKPKGMISFEAAFNLCKSIPELASISVKVVVGEHAGEYSSDLSKLVKTKEGVDIEPVESETTALITFTTGSSGVPKGANRTHRFLAAQHKALDKCIPYIEKDVDLPVFPIFSLNNLAGGVTTVLPAIDLAAPSSKDSSIIVNQVIFSNITCCTLSPSIFSNLAEHCNERGIKLSNLRRVVTGGAPVSEDNIKRFKLIAPNAEIWVLYGSTEVEPIAHIRADEILGGAVKKEGVNVGNISEDLEYKFIKIYKSDIELRESGWDKWEIKKGEVGELVVSGFHVCRDYYNNPEAVKSSKIIESDGKVWHRTGDLAYMDEDDNLWIVGRVHNVILRANKYLFPVQAEILLKKLPFVRQAAFLGVKDEVLGEKACVVISLKESFSTTDDSEHIGQVRDFLIENKIPVDEVKIIGEIPMDPRHHSKVEYSKLKAMLKYE